MDAVTITLQVPEVPDLPIWQWVVCGSVVWYVLSAFFVRLVFTTQPGQKPECHASAIGMWLVSPVFFPLAIACLCFGSVISSFGHFLTSRVEKK